MREFAPEDTKARSFEHLMLKEIYEQPEAIRRTIRHHVNGVLFSESLSHLADTLASAEKILIAASGSSRNAGLVGETMLEDMSGVAVDVEYASEYSYRSHRAADRIVIVMTQSGETADTIAAQREAHARGAKTIAICNVPRSTIAREADATLLTKAAPELSVPATKSFTTQLTVLYLIALYMGTQLGAMSGAEMQVSVAGLRALTEKLEVCIPQWDRVASECAERQKDARNVLFLGRSVHYGIAREGALKLKEISNTQAEGYPTGELKHGPFATVTRKSPTVVLATRNEADPGSAVRYGKTLSIMRDIKEQGGTLIAVANDGDTVVDNLAQNVFTVPNADELMLPILEVIPLQLFAYHMARLNGCDVDRPRNLVKSVVRE